MFCYWMKQHLMINDVLITGMYWLLAKTTPDVMYVLPERTTPHDMYWLLAKTTPDVMYVLPERTTPDDMYWLLAKTTPDVIFVSGSDKSL